MPFLVRVKSKEWRGGSLRRLSGADLLELAGGRGKCPIDCEVRNIFPANFSTCVVAAAREQLVCGDCFGMFHILFEILAFYRGWKNMIVATCNEQHGVRSSLAKLYVVAAMWREVCEPTLE